ncbi:MAG: hypothetical protein WCL18_06415 [bacterium]
MTKTKKTKILLVGWQLWVHDIMLINELKELATKFEIAHAIDFTAALDEIAKAKWKQQNPIRGIVFHRNISVINSPKCKLIADFAEAYSRKSILVITMIEGDEDIEGKKSAVSINYCDMDDWKKVKVMFDISLKK